MAKKLKFSEEEIKEILSVVDFCNDEDNVVRERQIVDWKRYKLMWEGINDIYFNAVAHDWRTFPQTNDDGSSDQSYYDKRINVFRAYLESIMAALSITVPPVKCFPDDAESSSDLSTARAGDKIAELIYRHNDIPILWIHGLFVFSTEGMVACYDYSDRSEKYGTYKKDITENASELHEITKCPLCEYIIEDNILPPEEANVPNDLSGGGMDAAPAPDVMDEGIEPPSLAPPTAPVPANTELNDIPPEAIPQEMNGIIPPSVPPTPTPDMGIPPQIPPVPPEMGEMGMSPEMGGMDEAANEVQGMIGQDVCPNCHQLMMPQVTKENYTFVKIIGNTDEPKSRVCMKIYGGLNVKVPNYAKCQEDIPYLIKEEEINVVMAIQKYESLKGRGIKKVLENIRGQAGQVWNEYEQWGRLSPQYRGEYPENVVTERLAWLRPAAFNYLEEERADHFKKKAPKGMLVKMINDSFCEACEENLDDHWSLINYPGSDYLHFDPLGSSLTSIQEITIDLVSLVLQTIEHGIGQTFADPNVLDFKAYKETEVLPGGIFPAIPKSGKALNDAFFEVKTATLSQEVLPFYQNVQQMGQLTSGALPSLFGGQLAGSETASEYSMSRAQALQRLQNTWKTFTTWWKYCIGKAINIYIQELEYDERNVERRKDGSFFNTFIRRSELNGKIGKVELEANENLPLTWSQQKDVIMTLLQANNPMIQQFIMAPENLPLIREAIGLTDFFVPGENDVEAEYETIQLLLQSEPIPNPKMQDPNAMMEAEMTGMPIQPMAASIPVEVGIDNHVIRYEVCRNWLVSEVGRQTKVDNKAGYENVLLRAKEHLLNIDAPPPDAEQGGPEGGMPKPPNGKGSVPGEKIKQTNKKTAPINGENDVATIQ